MKQGVLISVALLFCLLILSSRAYCEETTESFENQAEEQVENPSGAEKKNGMVVFPMVFYTPETALSGGMSLIYYYRGRNAGADSRPSNINLLAFYTRKEQAVFQLAADHYFEGGLYHGIGALTYSNYPQKFYGIGNDTSESDEETYVSEYSKLEGKFLRKLRRNLYIGIQAEVEQNSVIEPEEGGRLERGEVTGSRGGVFTGGGIVVHWDSRDNVFYPSTGAFHQLSAKKISTALGGDFDFKRYTLDVRKYVATRPSHVLALQGYLDMLTGSPPFNRLAKIGGQNLLRGFFQGRYRDRNMLVLQVEYRMHLWERFGLAGFAGLGDVADRLGGFELKDFKSSAGVGVRYMLDSTEKITLRLDFGVTPGETGVYLMFFEAI